MVLCTDCKWFLKNRNETLFVCWALDEDVTIEKALDDIPCDCYEHVGSDLS